MIPSVAIETSEGNYLLDLESSLFKDRCIFINGEINSNTLLEVELKLLYLKKVNKPITIYLNSQGGEVISGLAIYDLLKDVSNKCEITCVVSGLCASIATVIICGCDRVKCYKNSRFLIHEPSVLSGTSTSSVLSKTVKDVLKTKTQLFSIIATKTNKSLKEIENIVGDSDLWLDSLAAKKLGLVDEII